MRKILVLVLVVILLMSAVFTLTGCNTARCDWCRREMRVGALNHIGRGTMVCDDCMRAESRPAAPTPPPPQPPPPPPPPSACDDCGVIGNWHWMSWPHETTSKRRCNDCHELAR